ncbi:MAG: DUF1223 domain-containing protein [Planctomycetota bacterium]
MRRNLRALIVFAVFLLGWLGWQRYDARPLLDQEAPPSTPGAVAVLELFTSEGCSSCPPADALLGEVADAPGVFALAFHVDYWDHLGWRDPYGQRAFSQRQRVYSARLSGGRVYTPQLVINGAAEAIGSSRFQVRGALDRALARPAPATVALTRAGGRLAYRVEGAPPGACSRSPRSCPRPRGTRRTARTAARPGPTPTSCSSCTPRSSARAARGSSSSPPRAR